MKKIILILCLLLSLSGCDDHKSGSIEPEKSDPDYGISTIDNAYQLFLGTSFNYSGSDELSVEASRYFYDHYLNSYVYQSDIGNMVPYLYGGDRLEMAFGLASDIYNDRIRYNPRLYLKADNQNTTNNTYEAIFTFDLLDENNYDGTFLRYDLYAIDELNDEDQALLRIVISQDFEYLADLDHDFNVELSEDAMAYALELRLTQEKEASSLIYDIKAYDQTFSLDDHTSETFELSVMNNTNTSSLDVEILKFEEDESWHYFNSIAFDDLPSFLPSLDLSSNLNYQNEKLSLSFKLNDEVKELILSDDIKASETIRLLTSGERYGIKQGVKLPFALIYVGDEKGIDLSFDNELPPKERFINAKEAYALFIKVN